MLVQIKPIKPPVVKYEVRKGDKLVATIEWRDYGSGYGLKTCTWSLRRAGGHRSRIWTDDDPNYKPGDGLYNVFNYVDAADLAFRIFID